MTNESAEKSKEVGATIREYRQRKGISQNELARLARTTPTSVSRIECGVQRPGRRLAPALSRVLGIDLSFLMSA